MAVPDQRSSHTDPTSRLGGVAILAGMAIGFGTYAATASMSLLARLPVGADAILVVIGFLVLIAAALADDFFAFGFRAKLAAQTAAAFSVMASGCVIAAFPLPFGDALGTFEINYALTLFWLVGLTNAFNFMDGLDGLSGGQALIAALFLGLIAVMTGNEWLLSVCIVVGASVLGFLVFNFPPARIFMGDAGSQVIGFSFAVLAVAASLDANSPVHLLVVPMLFFGFIWDTVFTFFRRLMRGERVSQAHKSHLYQLLNQSGLSHKAVALTSYGMMVVQGLCALALILAGGAYAYALFAPLILMQAVYSVWAWRRAGKCGLLG